MTTQPPSVQQRQRGVTLVELMVALFISAIIALAAFAALVGARQGFSANNTAAELRDNSRYIATVLQQLIEQAGYLPYTSVSSDNDEDNALCAIYSHTYKAASDKSALNQNRSERCRSIEDLSNTAVTDANLSEGSDILTLHSFSPSEALTGNSLDARKMMTCAGTSDPSKADGQSVSRIYLRRSGSGSESDPYDYTLMCQANHKSTPEVILGGVEYFRTLYAICSDANCTSLQYKQPDSISDEEWGRLMGVRIGLVFQSGDTLAPEAPAEVPTYYPFDISDYEYRPQKADRKMRTAMSINITLRNPPR